MKNNKVVPSHSSVHSNMSKKTTNSGGSKSKVLSIGNDRFRIHVELKTLLCSPCNFLSYILFCCRGKLSKELKFKILFNLCLLMTLMTLFFVFIFIDIFVIENLSNFIFNIYSFIMFLFVFILFFGLQSLLTRRKRSILKLLTIQCFNCYTMCTIFFGIIFFIFIVPIFIDTSKQGLFRNFFNFFLNFTPLMIVFMNQKVDVQKFFWFFLYFVILLIVFVFDVVLVYDEDYESSLSSLQLRFEYVKYYAFLFVFNLFLLMFDVYRTIVSNKKTKVIHKIREIVYFLGDIGKYRKLVKSNDGISTYEENMMKDIIFQLKYYKSYLPSHLYKENTNDQSFIYSSNNSIMAKRKLSSRKSMGSNSSFDKNDMRKNSSISKSDSNLSFISSGSSGSSNYSSSGSSGSGSANRSGRLGRRKQFQSNNSLIEGLEGEFIEASQRGIGLSLVQTEQTILVMRIGSFEVHLHNLMSDDLLSVHSVYISEVERIVEKHNGYFHTFFGEEVFVSFNSPVRKCMTPEVNACKCAMEIQKVFTTKIRKVYQKRFKNLRINLNMVVYCDYIHSGNLGSASMKRYTHLGLPVKKIHSMLDLCEKTNNSILANDRVFMKSKFYFCMKRVDIAIYDETHDSPFEILDDNIDDSEKSLPKIQSITKLETLTNQVTRIYSVSKQARSKKGGSKKTLNEEKQKEWYDEIKIEEDDMDDEIEKIWDSYEKGEFESTMQKLEIIKEKHVGILPKELMKIYKRMETNKLYALQLKQTFPLVNIRDRVSLLSRQTSKND